MHPILKIANVISSIILNKLNVLITGADGQLGSCIKDRVKNYPLYKFNFHNSKTLDITDKKLVETFVTKNDINYIINCAAYTAVDKAESEVDIAYKVNETGVLNLAEAANRNNAKMIHFSTDYVFAGDSDKPYLPDSTIDPQGVYGASKAAGEKALLNSKCESIIIRTSWVYSEYGNNFYKTMHRLGAEKESLNVVNDQIGCPTYAGDLALLSLSIVDSGKLTNNEIYHYCNAGKLSWYDFAKEIMKIAEHNCKINPIPTNEYPTPALRPPFSLMNTEKIAKEYGISIPWWKDSLLKCHNNFQKLK